MFSSISTFMAGDFASTSNTFAPALVGEASTFTTILSRCISIKGRLAVTVTFSKTFLLCSKLSGGISTRSLLKENNEEYVLSKPTEEAVIKYFPSLIAEK